MTLPPTVIPAHTKVEGRIESPADLTVEGRCDGQIDVGGTVRVVANATCKAAVHARVAEIYGEVIGDVVCTGSILVATGARVVGNLRAPEVSVDSGCDVNGKIDLLSRLPTRLQSAEFQCEPVAPACAGRSHLREAKALSETSRAASRPLPHVPRRVALCSTRAQLALAPLLVALAACGATPKVDLDGTWPEKAGSYERVTRDWTRGEKAVRDFDSVLEVHATFLSPQWRTAYVSHLAARMSLPADERAALLEEQRKHAAEFHEFELLVSTYVGRENDLQKGDDSIWRVVLADDQGNEVTPVEIKRDRRPREVIRELFPEVPDFSQAYVARFPRTIEVLRPDAAELSLRVSGPRASLKLVWQGK